MTDRQPSEVTNLDRYGHSVLPWSRPHDLLSSGPNGPLTGSSSARCARTGARMSPGSARSGTTATCISPAGFTSGPGTRKARNLASNPACTIAVKFSGLDLTLEGEAAKVTDPAILDRCGQHLPRHRMACRGSRRCRHRTLQRAERRAAALAFVPVHLPHCRWSEHDRAERRDMLALQLMTRLAHAATIRPCRRMPSRLKGDWVAGYPHWPGW